MADLLVFWKSCAVLGWKTCWETFLLFDSICLFVASGLLWRKLKYREQWNHWEDAVMKWAFVLFVSTFLASMVVISPFIEYRDAKKGTTDINSLRQKLGNKEDIIQTQLATIQSYQAENTRINRELSEIERKRDPSVPAVKRRLGILTTNLFDFLAEWDKEKSKIKAYQMEAWGKSAEFESRIREAHKMSDTLNNKMVAQFSIQFIGRFSTMRDQLKELGKKTPKLDEVLRSVVRLDFEIKEAGDELLKLIEEIDG